MNKFFIFIFAFTLVLFAKADNPPNLRAVQKLGFELNFTNWEIFRSKDSTPFDTENETTRKYKESFKNEISKKCPKCRIAEFENKYGNTCYRVTTPEKFYFDITTDPGVVEIIMQPLTVTDLARFNTRINHYVFETANDLNLTTQGEFRDIKADHIHLGISEFFNRQDPKLFLAFIVDFYKQNQFEGTFTQDRANALPFYALEENSHKEFGKIVLAATQGKYSTIEALVQEIQEKVLNNHFYNFPESENFRKYMILNFLYINSKKHDLSRWTVETRSTFQIKSSEDMLLIGELLVARIGYLFIEHVIKRKSITAPPPREVLPQSLDSAYKYITESKLNFSPYLHFLIRFDQERYLENPQKYPDRGFQARPTGESCQFLLSPVN